MAHPARASTGWRTCGVNYRQLCAPAGDVARGPALRASRWLALFGVSNTRAQSGCADEHLRAFSAFPALRGATRFLCALVSVPYRFLFPTASFIQEIQ
jgi:hypothetical protein